MIGPLSGKTILITRPAHQSSQLTEPLEKLGATVVSMPAIEICPPEDIQPLDEALQNLDRFDWVVLTSVNGVEAVRRRMEELGIPAERLTARKIAVIGPATGKALAAAFREPDLVPEEFVSESIAESLGDVRGQRFLFARADIARKDLVQILLDRGAVIDDLSAYRILPASADAPLPDEAPDYIALTSSSAARGTLEGLRSRGRESWMSESTLVCIGPITAGTVRELGFEVGAMAGEYTIPGLVAAIVDHAQATVRTNA